MASVVAHRKELSDATRARIQQAARDASAANDALWDLCLTANDEGSQLQIAEAAGVPKSVLQERLKEARSRRTT